MSGDEARLIFGLLKGAYPRETFPRERRRVLWHFLRDLAYADVAPVVDDLIASSVWCPTIADIRRRVMEGRLALPSDLAAWEEVTHRLGAWARHEDLAPWSAPAVEAACREIGGLHAIGQARDIERLRKEFLSAYTRLRSAAVLDADRASRDATPALTGGSHA